jgi:hypothetical protein
MAQYQTATDLRRDDVPYVLITNGWGPGFESHTISWLGTSFTVEAFTGTAGSNGEPAGYPTVYCGRYSNGPVPDCGLPAPIASTASIRTGWRWAANGNAGAYNAAYDIWVGDGTRLLGYLMVWLHDPPRFQPAGSRNSAHQDVTVANTPGVWDLFTGTVNGLPIVNYVQPRAAICSRSSSTCSTSSRCHGPWADPPGDPRELGGRRVRDLGGADQRRRKPSTSMSR